MLGSGGYVKIYRSVMKKGFYKNPSYLSLWVHLLFRANHKEDNILFDGKEITLKRGQFITSRKSLSKETGIQESLIERILKFFKTEQQIEQQGFNKFRLITILNYDTYQHCEQQNEQPVNSQRTASEQPVNTDNTYKESKEHKKPKEEITLHSDDDIRLVQLLLDLMQSNFPDSKAIQSLTPSKQKAWLNECRLLRESDKRTPEQIEEVIRFSQESTFWKANILSMPKLRQKWDTLWMQMKRDSPASKYDGIKEWLKEEQEKRDKK